MNKLLVLFALILSTQVFADVSPEAIRTTNVKDICTTLTSTIRNVPASVKKKVFIRDNGIASHKYEVDHRIALGSGGANDISNLKLQDYNGSCNAHDKDKLEVRLHSLICNKKISVQEAQNYLYNDWESGYTKYINTKGCK